MVFAQLPNCQIHLRSFNQSDSRLQNEDRVGRLDAAKWSTTLVTIRCTQIGQKRKQKHMDDILKIDEYLFEDKEQDSH